MIDEVKKRTSWPTIDELEIKGDYRKRDVVASHQKSSFRFIVTFGSSGQVRDFKEI
jgi:hypothetical protein